IRSLLVVQLHPHPTLVPYTTLFRSLEWVSLMVFPFCAITLPMALWINTGYAPKHFSYGMGAHILVSISAYAMLALAACQAQLVIDRKSTRLNSSHVKISYAVFCLKK